MERKIKKQPKISISYYLENLKKMAERNRTDKEKHKRHSEFMKNKFYAAKSVEYNNKIYKSMTEAINQTGLSRYYILKQGGKFIKGIK